MRQTAITHSVAVVVVVGEGRSSAHVPCAYVLPAHACHDFLFLVEINGSYPLGNRFVESTHFVHIGAGTLRGHKHLVRIALECIPQRELDTIIQPVNRLVTLVGRGLGCLFIGEIFQQVLPLSCQPGDKRVEDVMLRIDKRIIQSAAKNGLLAANQVVVVTQCVSTLRYQFEYARLISRLFGFPQAVGYQCHRLGQTGHYATCCAKEDIGVASHITITATGADSVGSGELVAVLGGVVRFPCQRYGDSESSLRAICRSGVGSRPQRHGHHTYVLRDTRGKGQTYLGSQLPIGARAVIILVRTARLDP